MHRTVNNLEEIKTKINQFKPDLQNKIKIIAVSKTFSLKDIKPIIEYNHQDFGENKVQEAIDKWTDIKKINQKIKLHLIGKLQINKVKFGLRIFDYIH